MGEGRGRGGGGRREGWVREEGRVGEEGIAIVSDSLKSYWIEEVEQIEEFLQVVL